MESKLVSYLITKRSRDIPKVKELKNIYNHCCQVCGTTLIMYGNKEGGLAYSEVCHIVPHGKEGLDDHPNMLVLCPNHHKLFDLGIISINPSNLSGLLHVDPNNELNTKKLLLKHNLSTESIQYHYENVFLPIEKILKSLS